MYLFERDFFLSQKYDSLFKNVSLYSIAPFTLNPCTIKISTGTSLHLASLILS